MEHFTTKRFIDRTGADNSKLVRADLEDGWTEEQARGLFESLDLVRAVPNWKAEHLMRLYHWCADHDRDHKTIEGQLEFVAYDLCSSHPGLGMALKKAATVEEARKSVEPYVKLLSAKE